MKAKILFICSVLWLAACSSGEDGSAQDETILAGEAIVNANCKVCHASGINGAPIIGNKNMWGPRVEQGEAVLVQHAMEGFGLMPAKGGKTDLTQEDITLAVKYFMAQVQ